MENNLNEIIGQLTDFLKNEVKTETIIGQQFQLGEFSCVPVMSVGLGLGVGGGDALKTKLAEATGIGGGAGMGMGPLGFLVTKGSTIEFILIKQTQGLSAAFEKIPDLIEKYLMKKNVEKKESVTE